MFRYNLAKILSKVLLLEDKVLMYLQCLAVGVIAGIMVYSTIKDLTAPSGPPINFTHVGIITNSSAFRPGGQIHVAFAGNKLRDDCHGTYTVRLEDVITGNQILIRDGNDVLPLGAFSQQRTFTIPLAARPGQYRLVAPSFYECSEGNYTVRIPSDPSNTIEIHPF